MAHEWQTHYTQELADAICVNLEDFAMPLTLAAEAEGVHRAQVYAWMNENLEFHKQVTRARARGAKVLIELAKGAQKGSSTATWLLERRYRDDYAPPKKEDVQPSEVRITVEGGLPARPSESVHVEKTALEAGAGEAPA